MAQARVPGDDATKRVGNDETELQQAFAAKVRPFLDHYCVGCHNLDEAEAGIRVDGLNGDLEERHLKLWEGIAAQVESSAMPPEDERQPSDEERQRLLDWIDQGLLSVRRREAEKNGSVRRLTVAQYQNTLRDLLGLRERLSDILPADAVSKDGFQNNEQAMQLSPLLLEAYFDIAGRALDLSLVDEATVPVIQNFRMDFGRAINPAPCPDALILGANSHLLKNDDFVIHELSAEKPFEFTPFKMRTKYRFIEGYQGNDTVRGWRDYNSLYHSVFACMRGTDGYPKGLAYETIPEGLLLRPAIPSAELFQIASTYGPKANFKISLRELPPQGRFRVKVRAAKYDDGLLLDPGTPEAFDTNEAAANETGEDNDTAVEIASLELPQSIEVPREGIYQVDVAAQADGFEPASADASRLREALIGRWQFEDEVHSREGRLELSGQLLGSADYLESPFGKAVTLDGDSAAVVVPGDAAMNVGESEFTLAAWIFPKELRQAGIVSRGGYGYTHGWLLDMPAGNGVLRLETATREGQHNGTVQSRPGMIRVNQWQHVAAVVRPGSGSTCLYVNGQEVAAGKIEATELDNAEADLLVGRIRDANLFRGEIDEVRIYRRALDVNEIRALVARGNR